MQPRFTFRNTLPLPPLALTVFAVIGTSVSIGCNHRQFAPEIEYRSENVRKIREALEMPVDSIPPDHINAMTPTLDADKAD